MGAGVLHQRDACLTAPAEAVAEPGDEFKPRRAATDHNNSVEIVPYWTIGTVRNHNRRIGLGLTFEHVRHPGYSE
jgi:hypothetical protein